MKLNEIIKKDNIIKVSPGTPLSSALSKLSSSHDAAFVFDEKDNYIGVVNPYFCLIKTSLPGNAKLEHCLFHAPKIHFKDPVTKVAQLMIESKIHYLPIFDQNDTFMGIISARRLLSSFSEAPFSDQPISNLLKTKAKKVISIQEDEPLAHALTLFKKHKVSKLIVVGKDKKLKGVLSHYDLISYLTAPRQKEHQGDRAGKKTAFTNQQVKNFAKPLVLTLSESAPLKKAWSLILEKQIGSVVIVDEDNYPQGILTTKDFLTLLHRHNLDKPIEITTNNLSEPDRMIVANFFDKFKKSLQNFPDIMRAKLLVKEEKGGKLYKVILSLIPKRGKPVVHGHEGHDLRKVLKKVGKKE